MGCSDVSKPEDIPQSVLAVAEEAYQQAIYMTTSDEPQNMVLMVARAIMAERARCAKVCEDQAQQFLSTQYSFNQPLGSFLERFACGECADAIRKGTP